MDTERAQDPGPEPAHDTWVIEPTGPLRGDVAVRGSKNAVTKHLVAAMLGATPSVIDNAPEHGEVGITVQILTSLGVGVTRDGDTLTVHPTATPQADVPVRFSGLNRIPILLLGPLLNLVGEAFVPLVGGDRIGSRPIDFHVAAMRAMGAEITLRDDGVEATATRLRGAKIELPYPSVMATESVLLAAVLAEGKTVLSNAATEPEVVELALFLQRMGASVELQPNRRIVIEGVPKLSGASITLAGDRIEAFSYLCAGLVTGGEVRVFGCPQDRLVTAINTLHRMGADVEVTDFWVSARADGPLKPIAVQTDTHPGFMTDWQTPLVALLSQADGMSVFHETVFENRFVYVPALQAMGMEIELYETCLGGPACRFHDTNYRHSAVVKGVSKLHGAEVTVADVRAGFSLVIAAAAADSPSTLHDIHHLVRGYHRPEDALRGIGLNVARTAGA